MSEHYEKWGDGNIKRLLWSRFGMHIRSRVTEFSQVPQKPFTINGGYYLSDNKKYYYLKLKDNYFDQDNIKVLESMPNGHLYSLIILKLYLKACKYLGHLKMTETIPYDPTKINILAQVIGHDKDNVEKAIKQGINLGLITILESGEIWMTEIQNYIGHSSSEGDRKREYRAKLKGEIIPIGQMSGQMSDKQAPEIEIELEKEKEIYREGKFFNITEERHNKYKQLYPKLDIDFQYDKMDIWLEDNPKKQKTDRGYPRFVSGWLDRANKDKQPDTKSTTPTLKNGEYIYD